ncbi:hypothetical protein AK812_SmicGene33166, partial [Symbiodinium microadriaticum]
MAATSVSLVDSLRGRKTTKKNNNETLLESMSEALKQDPAALNQFTPKRKLVETMSGASVAFKVTVGFRSTQCQILYDAFARLAGLSVLQLIAANMHKERQKHGREAEEGGKLPGVLGTLGIRSAGRHETSGAQHFMCWMKDCVEKFFRDHSCGCALASAAPLRCFQLKRYEFNVRTGAVNKLVTPVSFTETSLQVPIWDDVSTLQTKQVCYRVSAIAFHEGVLPTGRLL